MRHFLPQSCLLCGTTGAVASLCPACAADLPLAAAPACAVCALPLGDAQAHGIACGACLRHPPSFDHTLAGFRYGFPVDRLLQAFKYSGELALAETLALPLARAVDSRPRPDLLLPMPLHPLRLRERGFNQALEIARPLAHWLKLPLQADGCRRIRDTASQAGMKWKERQRNVRGAFACDLDLNGKRVAVLDDVMTTGATLNEISRVLKARGAAEVSAWVVARTPKD